MYLSPWHSESAYMRLAPPVDGRDRKRLERAHVTTIAAIHIDLTRGPTPGAPGPSRRSTARARSLVATGELEPWHEPQHLEPASCRSGVSRL